VSAAEEKDLSDLVDKEETRILWRRWACLRGHDLEKSDRRKRCQLRTAFVHLREQGRYALLKSFRKAYANAFEETRMRVLSGAFPADDEDVLIQTQSEYEQRKLAASTCASNAAVKKGKKEKGHAPRGYGLTTSGYLPQTPPPTQGHPEGAYSSVPTSRLGIPTTSPGTRTYSAASGAFAVAPHASSGRHSSQITAWAPSTEQGPTALEGRLALQLNDALARQMEMQARLLDAEKKIVDLTSRVERRISVEDFQEQHELLRQDALREVERVRSEIRREVDLEKKSRYAEMKNGRAHHEREESKLRQQIADLQARSDCLEGQLQTLLAEMALRRAASAYEPTEKKEARHENDRASTDLHKM
jgi:hypothetical protein